MKKFKFLQFLLVAIVVGAASIASAFAQQMPMLPIDTAVRYGKLPNGLTYYIRHNALPEKRVHFYIAQKVGSVQEEENQRGLAHFLEHMCFNGTQHFPGNGVVKYCESIGVKFGENLNAYTSTDETVYNIDGVPVSDSNIDSCLWILHDWADGLLLETAEIDKERGVIHEEWRMRSSAMMRILNRQLPNLYPGSRYGERMPIGLMSVIDNFEPDFLRAYYEKWYRPDLQGIIIVGDIDVDQVEAKVKSIFSTIKPQENPAAYELYPVPDNAEPIYIVDKDKEQSQAIIQVFFKQDAIPAEMRGSMGLLVMNYMESMATSTLNARLSELSKNPDCPFVAAMVSYDNYLVSKTKDAFNLIVVPKDGQTEQALQTAMEEIVRARQFGFNATEIYRSRDEFMSSLESVYNNREKQQHNFFTKQYVRHFLEGDAIPDLETEYNIYKMLSAQLPVEAVNEFMKEMTASTDTNFVCLAVFPEKEGVAIPTTDDLRKAVTAAVNANLTAYVDNVKDEPLVPKLPKRGKINKEEAAPFGYTCWTLKNGARVYFKKTDFNESQVLFSALSKGGTSLYDVKDFPNYEMYGAVMESTGLGNFTSTELQKKLAGKQVSCSSSLGEAAENLSGSSTPKDLRTLFELIYLQFQRPCYDPEGFNTVMNMYRTQLANAEKLPDMAFTDSLLNTVYGHNPRAQRIHLADLDKVSYDRILAIHSERFANGGDFDFFFTGNFDTDSLRLFVEQYIAPLKAQKKRENYNPAAVIQSVQGVKNNHFIRPMETPQAKFVQIWNGDLPYTVKNAAVVNALSEILSQRYLKSIREEGSMAYSVGAYGAANFGTRENYNIQVYCPVKPEKKDSALMLVRLDIDKIAAEGVTAEELQKVKEFEVKDFADKQRKNGYWQGLITSMIVWGKDTQKDYIEITKALTSDDIRDFVRNVLLKQNNVITVSMLPADLTEKE